MLFKFGKAVSAQNNGWSWHGDEALTDSEGVANYAIPPISKRSLQANAVIGLEVIGIGAIAGPICACAVALEQNSKLRNLLHTGELEERELISEQIMIHAKDWSVGICHAEEIDVVGSGKAVGIAANRAISGLDSRIARIYMDSVHSPETGFPVFAYVGCGERLDAVMAAGVLAEHHLREVMISQSSRFGRYGFEENFGYPSAAHLDAISMYGVCEMHRRSTRLVRRLLEEREVQALQASG